MILEIVRNRDHRCNFLQQEFDVFFLAQRRHRNHFPEEEHSLFANESNHAGCVATERIQLMQDQETIMGSATIRL